MANIAELAVAPQRPLVAGEQKSTDIPQGRKRRIITGMGLAAIAAAGGLTEQFGLQHHLPDVVQFAYKGSKHPVLGYAGAWAAVRWSRKHKLVASIAAASAANFVAESGQGVVFDPDHDPLEFLAHDAQPENIYDYGFAVAGLVLFVVQNKRLFRN